MTKPTYEVIVFGATSFVGQILCRYLLDQFGVGKGLRWAAAGRSMDKLKALRADLGAAAADLELVVADAADEDALEALCADTQVVVSTVGPYALYGEPLVRICAESGTDYCDLTGEVQWIARMLVRYEAAAKASGARIVHCCGVDAIPSDLGVYFLQQQAQERFGTTCNRVKMRVKAMRGGFSGGTAASLLNVVKEASKDPALRKALVKFYPSIEEMRLVDYKVRVLDDKQGTEGMVRVLVESHDAHDHWTTVGVSPNVIDASYQALVDAIDFKLYKDEKRAALPPEASATGGV